ncbi:MULTISPECIES: sigma-70 family RNA polymerase sigma factor [unclassified Microbacterium]|uniref:sigma-70 family RNA polymerase sigma factor n=1 Tax=unclassified Microbacterium TaxID=2609290 RepID=UPI002882D88A|nr:MULTISPECIES: sigma-70 family RNA polymerase sigma factor [unclassified Microbacterium]
MPLRARNQLVVDHLHIVGAATAHIAAKLTQAPRDDLAAAGAFALVRAAEKFNESLGVPFGAYARERINWAMLDELRSMDWAPAEARARAKATTRVQETLSTTLGRRPTIAEIAEAMGVATSAVKQGLEDAGRTVTSLDVPAAVDVIWAGDMPEESAMYAERDELLHHAIDALPDRKRFIIHAIYFDDRTVKDIAAEIGVSHAAVSQHRSEAMRMLRDAIDRHYADDPRAASAPTSHSSPTVLDAYFGRIAEKGQRFARAFLNPAHV